MLVMPLLIFVHVFVVLLLLYLDTSVFAYGDRNDTEGILCISHVAASDLCLCLEKLICFLLGSLACVNVPV